MYSGCLITNASGTELEPKHEIEPSILRINGQTKQTDKQGKYL